ncbi:hypothetical protein ACEZDB_12100 [Streptacidiphilus sp. N1-3]|uniref:Uncharacterized protein n=1 Tax=Streptacidiphilus alkalitolerans TaxID=3342712 RepID=A0ABV6WZM6_9ACTN
MLRASAFNAALAALAAQAGSAPTEHGDLPGRIAELRARIQAAGLEPLTAQADLALVLHYAICGDQGAAAELVEQMQQQAPPGGDHACPVHAAAFLADQPLPKRVHPVRRLVPQETFRDRWSRLVDRRRISWVESMAAFKRSRLHIPHPQRGMCAAGLWARAEFGSAPSG